MHVCHPVCFASWAISWGGLTQLPAVLFVCTRWDMGPDVGGAPACAFPACLSHPQQSFHVASVVHFGCWTALTAFDDSMPGVAPFHQASWHRSTRLCCVLQASRFLACGRCYITALNHMYMWWFLCWPHLGLQLVTMLCLHVHTQGLSVLCLLRHDVGNQKPALCSATNRGLEMQET